MTAEELMFFQMSRVGFGHAPVLDACSPIVLLRRMMANLFSIFMRCGCAGELVWLAISVLVVTSRAYYIHVMDRKIISHLKTVK